MPAFVFLGAEPDVTETVAYGFRFVVGVPVEVTGEPATTKLRGNRFFEEAEAGVTSVQAPVEPEKRRPGRPRKVAV